MILMPPNFHSFTHPNSLTVVTSHMYSASMYIVNCARTYSKFTVSINDNYKIINTDSQSRTTINYSFGKRNSKSK